LVPVANHRDLSTLIQHLSAGGADVGCVRRVAASVTDTGDLLMYCADKSRTFDALNPVGLRAGRKLVTVAVWWQEIHVVSNLACVK